MEQSILTSTKKLLGIDKDYKAFDLDVLTHINSAFATLQQRGVGPVEGFFVEDEVATWDNFFIGNDLNAVRTYVLISVRLVFDPPANAFVVTSLEKQIEELGWRLQIAADSRPVPVPGTQDIDGGGVNTGFTSDSSVLDGGTP